MLFPYTVNSKMGNSVRKNRVIMNGNNSKKRDLHGRAAVTDFWPLSQKIYKNQLVKGK